MEKTNKTRSLFIKFLPKPTSLAHVHKGFSGPINFFALPEEAQSRPKNNGNFHANEPKSPKVSCMGQIKSKHQKKKKQRLMIKATYVVPTNKSPPSISSHDDQHDDYHKNDEKSKQPRKIISALGKFFIKSQKQAIRSNDSRSSHHKMKKFDWTAQITPSNHDDDCCCDDNGWSDDKEKEEEEGGFGLKPRKEVNIWERRGLTSPPTLNLNAKVKVKILDY